MGYAKDEILSVADIAQAVAYVEEMCSINEYDEHTFQGLLFQKSKEWQREKEYRALYKLKGKDVTHIAPEIYYNAQQQAEKIYTFRGHAQTNNLEVLSADKYIIKKCKPAVVYLGMRMKWEDKKKIIEIADKHKMSVYQMAQEQNCFKFTCEKLI